MKISPAYRKLIEQIKIDGEDYSDEQMKSVYTEQKKELDRLYAIAGVLFIRHAIGGLLKMNATQKAGTGIKDILKTMGKKLGDSEVKKVTDILSTVYKDTYYKNLYTLESGMTINIKLPILKKEFVDAAVNAKFKGELFSDRIWSNKGDLIDGLQKSLVKAMNGEVTIDRVAKEIKDKFNVTAYDSSRLVNTEMARCQADASNEIANSLGIKRHIWDATLDNLTNPEDASYDGNIYDIDDDSAPTQPNHPNCRCAWLLEVYEGWSPTSRKNNISKEIIDYKNYADWAKDKGID